MGVLCFKQFFADFYRKDLSRAQREYKKKKAQKKAQRLKQMEDEREVDKNKWIQFNAKVNVYYSQKTLAQMPRRGKHF
jgi:U3 small nucleolar ribonucleoprotein component